VGYDLSILFEEPNMNNLILFTNAFLSYLLLFVIAVCVVIAAVLIGRKLRTLKDAKDAQAAEVAQAAASAEESKQ